MTSRTKTNVGILACLYLAVGFFAGSVIANFIPVMNVRGVIYYALTWPLWFIDGGLLHLHLMPVPSWAFTFQDARG